jgi:NAD(P)-dependent dehydrogenase (short-subunit alcohol dehydrogenase family)
MTKTILVTGGNRGIGLEICRQLTVLGHKVILGTRDLEKGNLAAEKMALPVDVQALDVTNTNHIDKLVLYITEAYGSLDVLINNAGVGIGSTGVARADLTEVKDIMETNFYGPWRPTQALLPLLEKSDEGRIVNMSSGMGALDEMEGGYAGYRMSKSALNALTILTANELANTSIKVNALCPGWVKTEMGGSGATRTVEQGADTAVWLSTEENIASGLFFRDRKVISW